MNVILGTAGSKQRLPRHGRAALLAAAACLFGLSLGLSAVAQSGDNQLQSVDVKTLAGQQVQLTLHTSGPAPQPLAFTIDKPARLSLDLPGVTLALSSRRIDLLTSFLTMTPDTSISLPSLPTRCTRRSGQES